MNAPLAEPRARFVAWVRRRSTGLCALGLALLAFAAIRLHAPEVGYTRDEGFYFSAAESYAGWFERLAADPGQALGDAVVWQHFENNREHPVLIKNLMALAYLALAADLPRTPASGSPERTGAFAAAMRLPSQLFSAWAVALVFLLGAAVASRRVGLLAALAFFLAPRHFYHAQLACFDMPAVAVWLATVIAWRKAQTSLGWSIAIGAVWGLALTVKHNSFFLPLVLGLHWLAVSGREFAWVRQGLRLPRIPLAFFSMLVLGPLVFVAHWPLLWHDTFERLGWYFGFHLHHINYYWEYFGRLLTDPPFPWAYPFALTALTLPLPTLVLAGFGLLGEIGRLLGQPFGILGRALGRFAGLRGPVEGRPAEEQAPGSTSLSPSDSWLLLVNALLPMIIIALPSVPIFGGVKHWMHAMPFACILGAVALDRMLAALPARLAVRRRAWIWAGTASLVLLPSLQGINSVGGYGTSYYNELAGGVSGAADLGMQRQYWSNNVTGVMPWLNQNLPQGARVFLHEVTAESFHAYQRDGLLRADLRMGWSPDHADYTVYQYHREFVDTEYRVWNRIGQRTVLHGLYLDEVPLILVYDTRKPAARAEPKSRERS